jgi:hypothetical protein
MDYVYTCRAGDNEELRYSIRSVVQNLPEGRIWLIGGKPEWYVGDYIEVENERNKFYSINRCWDVIRKSKKISEDFILMNDDFYIIDKIVNVGTFHGGLLTEKIKRYSDQHGNNKYAQILSMANRKLQHSGIKKPLDYDIHVPMPISKSKITDFVISGLAPRSLYGNINDVGGQLINDVKVYDKSDSIDYSFNYTDIKTNIISSADGSFKNIYEDILKDMFVSKTQYEL